MTHHVGTTEVLHVVRRARKAMSAHPNAPLTPEGVSACANASTPDAHSPTLPTKAASVAPLPKWYKR